MTGTEGVEGGGKGQVLVWVCSYTWMEEILIVVWE